VPHLSVGQVRGRGMRWTEWLRDRLRPGWLRMRAAPDADEGPGA